MTNDTPMLEADNLSKRFGGIQAVDGLNMTVPEGEITGLIGPNGAGKTTTFNLLSGFYTPDSGTVRFKGTDLQEIMHPGPNEKRIWSGAGALTFGSIAGISASALGASSPGGLIATTFGAGLGAIAYTGQEKLRSKISRNPNQRPYQVARQGLSRTFQLTRELQGITVLENLMLAFPGQLGENLFNVWLRNGAVSEQEETVQERAEELLEFLNIDHLKYEYAGNLSGGQRKLLELGRVLMTDPDLLLLDEPAAGVNPTLTQKLLDRIKALSEEGYTFCIIEHDMEVIMELSDSIVVMDQGQKLMEGSGAEVKSDERVIDAYLGG